MFVLEQSPDGQASEKWGGAYKSLAFHSHLREIRMP